MSDGNFHVVNSLRSALHKGEHGLSTVPGLLDRVLKEGSWREFVTERGEHVEHEDIIEFVTNPPMRGLGATVDLIDDIVSGKPVQDAWDVALGRKPRSDKIAANDDNMNNSVAHPGRPAGTSRAAALRKLRTDAPELHAEVLAGNLSAHKAMVIAGFRPATFTVRPNPSSAARTLRKHMTNEQLAELARLLTEDN